MNGPVYPIIKRKRVPRGVERLRDRRWPRRPAPEVLVAVVREAANAEKADRTEVNKANEEAMKKIPGKPFAPKPKVFTAEGTEDAEGR